MNKIWLFLLVINTVHVVIIFALEIRRPSHKQLQSKIFFPFKIRNPISNIEDEMHHLLNAEQQSPIKHSKNNNASSRLYAFLKSTPYIKSVGLNAVQQLNFISEMGKKLNLPGDAMIKSMESKYPKGVMFPPCSSRTHISDKPLPFPGRFSCCPLPKIRCNRYSIFRTIDGSCNCRRYPDMGRSFTPLRRLLPPDYADGINEPRVGVHGNPLPSARLVSFTLFKAMPEKYNAILTQLHFNTGQMLDHDTDRIPITMRLRPDGTLENIPCDPYGRQTGRPEERECFPIMVPKDDPFFKKPCLAFIRSQAFFAETCRISPRQQANALTSWIDASMVYGSTKEELDKLRENVPGRGRLLTTDDPINSECGQLLPQMEDPDCMGTDRTIRCFAAGDERRNEQVGLVAMHTIFVRLHNMIEEKFHKLNPLWNGEHLFQEARKLVIGLWQNIVYNEYLPMLLGDDVMRSSGLSLLEKNQCFRGYNCKKYKSNVPNVFATAAFRMGHSQLGRFFRISNVDFTQTKDVPLSEVMFNPSLVYGKPLRGSTCGVEAIMLGLTDRFADRRDRFFTHQITRHLFTNHPPNGVGMDLQALNIQRGRDHGIPGYTKWREFCGLSVPTSFYRMYDIPSDIRLILASLYKNVEDIDLFPAAMSEVSVKGSIVGPTFSCLLSIYFKNAKFSDRFWFERCNTKEGFTLAQINNIKDYTLGRFYCDTLIGIKKIQKFPLMVPLIEAADNLGLTTDEVKRQFSLYKKSYNERVFCSEIGGGINFDLWKEKRSYY